MERLQRFAERLTALPFVDSVDIIDDDGGAQRCRLLVRTPRGDYRLAVEAPQTALSYAIVDRSLSAMADRGSDKTPWILLAPYVSPRMGAYLAKRGVNFIDELGNCRILLDNAYQALVEGRRPARRPVLQEGVRAPGYQVLLALLADPELLGATVREIAAAAGVGKTTAAKMIRRLREEQLIAPVNGGHRLLQPAKLVDRWLIAYNDVVRPHLFVGCFRSADADPAALVNRVEGVLDREGIAGVWSGGAALDRITGWYRGRSTVLHLAEVPPGLPRLLRALPAKDGDLTILRLPGPAAAAGIAPRTAHPLLIYTELMTLGDERAREMAIQFWGNTSESSPEMPLDAIRLAALRDLRRLWPDRRCVLVGATALDVWLGLRWRKTEDLDLALELTPEELSGGMATLSGWTRQSEQRWRSPDGVLVDLIPADPNLIAAGELVWPDSEARMSLVGGAVFFLTNINCASACLDFADLMLGLENVTHIGQVTTADTQYMEVRTEAAPSGLAKYVIPVKVYRDRLRAPLQAYRPEVVYDGFDWSDGAILAWADSVIDAQLATSAQLRSGWSRVSEARRPSGEPRG